MIYIFWEKRKKNKPMEIFLCVINVVINACMQEPYTSVSHVQKKHRPFYLKAAEDILLVYGASIRIGTRKPRINVPPQSPPPTSRFLFYPLLKKVMVRAWIYCKKDRGHRILVRTQQKYKAYTIMADH